MNKVLLSGKLTRKKVTGGETTVAAFMTVACQSATKYDLIDVVAFRHTAGYCNKYLSEGDFITVEGHLQYNADKKRLEVIAEEVHCIAHGRTWKEVQ